MIEENTNERSARKFMAVASVVEVFKTIAYLASTLILLIVGVIAYQIPQNGNQESEVGTAIATGASAFIGVLLILAGVALAICFVISLINMLMTLTALKKGGKALLAKKGRIVAGAVLSAFAALAFVVILISTIATNNVNTFVIAVCVIMTVFDVLSVVMKVQTLKRLNATSDQE